MRVFLDSSSFAKRFIKEKGSEAVDHILSKASVLGLSVICLPEIISALNRKRREGSLTPYEYSLAKNRLSEDLQDAEIIQLTPGVISHVIMLLEIGKLRAMDALHIACALEWEAELFVSSDKVQLKAARKVKLECKYV